MNMLFLNSQGGRRRALGALGPFVCALALAGAASANGEGSTSPTPTTPGVAATLEECVTSIVQAERSVTFTGEMTMLPGAVKMSMRIDIEERVPGEGEFHIVNAPGLGVWRSAEPKVKVYKYLKQVTNLTSPGAYRGLVRFRWISSKGHVIKRAERLTTKCLQPAAMSEPAQPHPETPEPSVAPPTSSTTTGRSVAAVRSG